MTLVSEIVRLGGGAAGTLLTPSTPFAYPQVVSRCFASFRVAKSSVSAAHSDFCSGFDSRQLHQTCRHFLADAYGHQQVRSRSARMP
jgi:hypothetical protein